MTDPTPETTMDPPNPSRVLSATDLDTAPILVICSPTGDVHLWIADHVTTDAAVGFFQTLIERVAQVPDYRATGGVPSDT